jgi:hypothetical protein
MPIDSDEEAGLRAFELKVGCHAGASYPDTPLWVEHEGDRRAVRRIDARWREEDRLGFRVRFEDGGTMLLYYVPELDLWSGTATPGTGTLPLRQRHRPAGGR